MSLVAARNGSVAWHSEMECEVAVRKAGRVVNDRELSYKMQREIAILQALRHENVRTRATISKTHMRAQAADARVRALCPRL